MTNAHQQAAEKLLKIQAVKLRPQEPFTWASGWKSPIYCDNRKILGFPYYREYFKSELCNLVFSEFGEASLIAGVATAGIAWGALVADQLKLPMVYVRPKPKEHGMSNQIEGHYEAGMQAVIIEDLVSTGKSSLQAAEALRREGIEVVGMVALFTYGFPQAAEAFSQAGIPLVTLTDYDSLIEQAIAQDYVQESQAELLRMWRLDPEGWSK